MNGISFYRPEFLWGLLFLAGVLLIHLLRRPRARAIDFSTLRFFREQAVSATRMRRLRSLLLLLVRLCAVALLVMLFARPFDKNDNYGALRDPHLTLFVWIDRTPSMDYAQEGVSLLARAGAIVDSLKEDIPATARILRYDEARNEFLPFDGAGPPRTRHGPPRLDGVMRAWNESRSAFSMPLLMLISDYQNATSGALDTLLSRDPPRSPVACVTLAPASPRNFSLRNAVFHEAEAASRISLSAAARGFPLDSGEITVTMSSVGAGSAKISVRANDTCLACVEAAGALKSPGGCVTLAAKDPLAFDNTAYFISRSRTARRVIVVGDDERAFPVAAAFLAAGADKWDPVTAHGSDQVEFDQLDSADVIVLTNLEKQPRRIEAFLASRSSSGKCIVFAIDADDEGLGRSAAIVPKETRPSRPLKLVTLAAPASIVLPDTISAAWRGFPALRTREVAVYRYAEGLPGDALLRLDNGAPLVTGLSDARGRSWIIVSTPIGVTNANNLCETGFFVPCLDRLVRYFGGEHAAPLDSWIAGFERRNPMYGSGNGASVYSEEGAFLDRWSSQPFVLLGEPGLYRIAPDGGEAYWMAANPDPAESELVYSVPPAAGKLRDKIMIFNETQLKEALKGRGRRAESIAWAALVLLLLAEIALWRRDFPPRSGPAT